MTATNELYGFIESTLKSTRVAGCSIALVEPSGCVWSRGFGLADIRQGRQAEPETVYHLFSGTKLYTATAVVQLAEQGRLELDDQITKHIPEAHNAQGVTLKHLLSHSSGLKDMLKAFLSVYFPDEAAPTSARALERYRIAAARPPGTKVEYRNVNYALLGEVISRVSGMEYREYVTRNVLAPLNMQAAFSVTDEMKPRAATGYVRRWDPMRLVLRFLLPDVSKRMYRGRVSGQVELNDYNLSTAAIGGLVGSVVDFARFVQAQLDGGKGILSEQSTRLMQTMVAEGKAGIESAVGVGLAWKFGRVGDRVFLNHEGGGSGFTSETRIYPKARVGTVLAMNGMAMPKTMKTAHRICEAVYEAREQLRNA